MRSCENTTLANTAPETSLLDSLFAQHPEVMTELIGKADPDIWADDIFEFQRLPPELRNEIYSSLLRPWDDPDQHPTMAGMQDEPEI